MFFTYKNKTHKNFLRVIAIFLVIAFMGTNYAWASGGECLAPKAFKQRTASSTTGAAQLLGSIGSFLDNGLSIWSICGSVFFIAIIINLIFFQKAVDWAARLSIEDKVLRQRLVKIDIGHDNAPWFLKVFLPTVILCNVGAYKLIKWINFLDRDPGKVFDAVVFPELPDPGEAGDQKIDDETLRGYAGSKNIIKRRIVKLLGWVTVAIISITPLIAQPLTGSQAGDYWLGAAICVIGVVTALLVWSYVQNLRSPLIDIKTEDGLTNKFYYDLTQKFQRMLKHKKQRQMHQDYKLADFVRRLKKKPREELQTIAHSTEVGWHFYRLCEFLDGWVKVSIQDEDAELRKRLDNLIFAIRQTEFYTALAGDTPESDIPPLKTTVDSHGRINLGDCPVYFMVPGKYIGNDVEIDIVAADEHEFIRISAVKEGASHEIFRYSRNAFGRYTGGASFKPIKIVAGSDFYLCRVPYLADNNIRLRGLEIYDDRREANRCQRALEWSLRQIRNLNNNYYNSIVANVTEVRIIEAASRNTGYAYPSIPGLVTLDYRLPPSHPVTAGLLLHESIHNVILQKVDWPDGPLLPDKEDIKFAAGQDIPWEVQLFSRLMQEFITCVYELHFLFYYLKLENPGLRFTDADELLETRKRFERTLADLQKAKLIITHHSQEMFVPQFREVYRQSAKFFDSLERQIKRDRVGLSSIAQPAKLGKTPEINTDELPPQYGDGDGHDRSGDGDPTDGAVPQPAILAKIGRGGVVNTSP